MIEHIAYWLIASEPHRSHFAKIISELAARFDAPLFEPHVTIYSGPLTAEDRPAEIISNARMGFAPISLYVTGASFSEEFTKTAFVEFAMSDTLVRLCQALKRKQSKPTAYELKPHLSLIYAPLSRAEKESLVRGLALPQEVAFDTIKAVSVGCRTRDRANVEAWQVVAECELMVRE